MKASAEPQRVTGEVIVEIVLDLEHDGARPVWWKRRRELCWDIPDEVVEEAAYDFLSRDTETLDDLEADAPRHDAICDLIQDPRAPIGIAATEISDEQIARTNEHRQASVTRRDAAYWIARERIAAVDNGVPVDRVVALPRPDAALLCPLSPRRLNVGWTRPRASRRRASRVARAPDDPSRPRRSRLAAADRRPGRPA